MGETYEFLFVRGGPVMYLILACSVAGVAVFIERLWSLRRRHVIPHDFAARLVSLLDEGKWSEAQAACRENNSSLARVAAAAIKNRGKERTQIEAAMESAGKNESVRLDRYIGWLGLIATIAPLLGLLGTVTGMIKMFQQVSARGIGDHKFVALGIWEALICTAAGLVVAIPAFVAYRYLIAKVDNSLLVLEETAQAVAERMAEKATATEDRTQ
jgi:biopolymer transport protein ExbB